MTEATAYLEQHIRDALGADERVGTLGLEVQIRGEAIYLSGCVATPQRRDAAAAVAAQLAPELTVHNDVSIVAADEPEDPEVLA